MLFLLENQKIQDVNTLPRHANHIAMPKTATIVFWNYPSSDRHMWFSGGLKHPLHNGFVLQVWHLPKWPWQNHTWQIPHGSSAWSVQPGCAHSDEYCLGIFGKESCSSWSTFKIFSKSSSVASAMLEQHRAHYFCEREDQTLTWEQCCIQIRLHIVTSTINLRNIHDQHVGHMLHVNRNNLFAVF